MDNKKTLTTIKGRNSVGFSVGNTFQSVNINFTPANNFYIENLTLFAYAASASMVLATYVINVNNWTGSISNVGNVDGIIGSANYSVNFPFYFYLSANTTLSVNTTVSISAAAAGGEFARSMLYITGYFEN